MSENDPVTKEELDAFQGRLEDTFHRMLEAILNEKQRIAKECPKDEFTMLLSATLAAVLTGASALSAHLSPDLLAAAEQKAADTVRQCAEELGHTTANIPIRKAVKTVHLRNKEELRSYLESMLSTETAKDPSKLN